MARFTFTAREQDLILRAIRNSRFYSLPDTLSSSAQAPFFLYVEEGSITKMVVWGSKADQGYHDIAAIENVIKGIIQEKAEYKALPPSTFRIEL